MSRLLVTGGAGFIGVNFVRGWLARHPADRCVVLDALTYAGRRESLDGLDSRPGFRFVQGDIRDRGTVEGLLREERTHIIVHFAAESHVDRSIAGPEVFVDVNVRGTQVLLEAARAVWLAGDGMPHRFHHVSTDEVYGSLEPGEPAFTEVTPYAPTSPYAASKAAADHLVRAYHRTFGLSTSISNCSNNYGPFHFPEKLIPLCIVNLLEGKALPVYGDGKNVRDWLYVEDHCLGLERVLADGRPGETYNIGGRCEKTNLEVVTTLCRMVDEVFAGEPRLRSRFPQAPPSRGQMCESLVRLVQDRPGHDRRYAIDPTKIEHELLFEPATSFEAGLAATVRWFIEHEAWWRSILAGGAYREWMSRQYAPRKA
ncbi:MAG: dTDP-glucose 4,6-dehydratase [Thermoanaerobaculia bacterium]